MKAIIFDADGMLNKATKFSTRFSKDFNVPIETMLPFFQGSFQECLIGKADLKEELSKHLQKWKWDEPVETLLNYWFERDNKLNGNLIQKIKLLRQQGIRCYLATNNEKYRTNYMIKKLGFKDLFEKVFSSADLQCKKPEPEFYEKMLRAIQKETGLESHHIQFWDDDEKNVTGAKLFGLKAYQYTDNKHFNELITSVLPKE